MSRSCATCQHLRRPEIDRRLAAGEPAAQVARAYEVNPSSLHRHRANCLKLGPSQAIKQEAARGSAAVALLPSKEVLNGHYLELRDRIDQIVARAEAEGSLKTALAGLNSIRHLFDSLARLAGHDRAGGTEINVAVQTNVQINVNQIAERLIRQFDHQPEVKAQIAQALLTMDAEAAAAVDPARNIEQVVHTAVAAPPMAAAARPTAVGATAVAAQTPAKEQQRPATNPPGRPRQGGQPNQPGQQMGGVLS